MAAARFVWWLSLVLAGCSYGLDKHPDACHSDADCASGLRCYRDFCVASDAHPSSSSAACETGTEPDACYEGAAGTEGVGACRAGARFCVEGAFTHCLDQVTPAVEICNARDDDCNGLVDDVAARSCEVTSAAGACDATGMIVCRAGAPSCEFEAIAGDESCNGFDDDCDGRTDEGIAGTCFPTGEMGCEQLAPGEFQCHGVCTTGTLSCSAGAEQCIGANAGSAEVCANGGPALDEDCDGRVDEGCPCESGSTQTCYGGPREAIGQGPCGPGTQVCSGGVMGPCSEQNLPASETCANEGRDDDCNGVVDDVQGLGTACTDTTARGECRNGTLQCVPGNSVPACVGGAPTGELCDAVDQDCDGNPVNGFDLNSNSRCGACDVACADGEVCCDGECMASEVLQQSELHCGACGITCGSFQYCCEGNCYNPTWSSWNQPPPEAACCAEDCGALTCCGAQCVDLQSDLAHCGACGNACGAETKACRNGACR